MSNEQLMDEKIAMQKALLYLESLHGRPTNKEDRDLVRPLYDKYRSLKRLISKTVLVRQNFMFENTNENQFWFSQQPLHFFVVILNFVLKIYFCLMILFFLFSTIATINSLLIFHFCFNYSQVEV